MTVVGVEVGIEDRGLLGSEEGRKQTRGPSGEQQAECGSAGRHGQALEHDLAHEDRPAGAERQLHRELPPPRGAPRQQQAAGIHTGAEEQQSGRPHHHGADQQDLRSRRDVQPGVAGGRQAPGLVRIRARSPVGAGIERGQTFAERRQPEFGIMNAATVAQPADHGQDAGRPAQIRGSRCAAGSRHRTPVRAEARRIPSAQPRRSRKPPPRSSARGQRCRRADPSASTTHH